GGRGKRAEAPHPADVEWIAFWGGAGRRGHGVGLKAALVAFAADVHLDQRGGRASALAGPPIELGREVETVERVDEIEELERLPHLVRLQVTDEMPRDRPTQRGDLLLCLLHAVLAERGHAGRHGVLDALDVDGFGDADQEDVAAAAAGALRRPGDALAHALEIRADVRHGCDSSTRAGASRERGECHEAATVSLAVRIEKLRMTRGTEPRVVDPCAVEAGRRQYIFVGRPEVEHEAAGVGLTGPALPHRRIRGRELANDGRVDFVAAGADRRADGGGETLSAAAGSRDRG